MLLTFLRLCKQGIAHDRKRLAAYHADLEAGRMSSHGNHENNHPVSNSLPSAINGTGQLSDSSAIKGTIQSPDSEGDGNLVHDSPRSSQEDGDVDLEGAASNDNSNVFAILKKASTWINFFHTENDDRKKETIILKNENDARGRETQILNDKIQRLQHIVFLLVARQEAHDAKANAGFTPIRRQLDSIVPKNTETPAPFVEV